MNIQGEPAPGHSSRRGDERDGGAHREAPGRGRLTSGRASPTSSGCPSRRPGSSTPSRSSSIFLVLAALYESWTVPISIVLALPLGVIGGVIASSTRGMANDVYFQIGLLTVLGLTTKNAILIVQFAVAATARRGWASSRRRSRRPRRGSARSS